ncbi:Uncharacterized protein LAWI1_G004549 [Lachnellula willkommii]|uniref:Nuclear segregation protein n=1 Tax=Lachnellula willkommii TaxID=215461 RepID=A0A559M689_9HELO|nr:Uncharacterized protein LAWI1_G004549 [Lachnellula willkommii]
MADLATPSGAAMFDAGGSSEKKNTITKPEKPDEETYKANLKQAEKEHADVMNKLNAVRAKIDLAKPSSKDSPSSKRRGELIAQLKEIREKQGAGKSGRASTFERIKALDENVKSAIQAQKVARGKVNFKGVEDLDREIDRLDKQVNSGMMKLVDEKKALSEISNLRKQRKVFAGFDESQKAIDTKKADLKKLRDTLDDPESKALSEKYNKLQAELDAIKAEQDEAYQGINALHDERKKLQDQQQEKWAAQKKLKDDYYQAGRAIQKYEYEARQRLRERKKAEQETYVKEKKRARAQEMLADASEPAYLAEIRIAESIIRYYDPKYTNEKAPLQAPSQFSAHASRTVDDAGIKGMKVVQKKDEEDYFAGTGGKKGKKGRKNNAAATPDSPAPSKSFSCPPQVMNDCASMGIEPPMSSADVEPVVEKVRAKLEFYKSDQKAQTEKNIAKAKKELERLEAEDEAPAAPAKTTETNGDAHGETKATAGVDEGGSVANEINLIKAAGSDVIADLQGASIEDKEE